MQIPEKVLIDSSSKIITNVFDKWILPNVKNIKMEIREIFNLNFKEYIARMYNDSKYINSLVFSKSPKLLEDLYVPLNLTSDIVDEKIEIFYPNKIREFIEKYKNIQIVDSAGMGKTTILKWMFKKSIELNSGIPILIELRKLNKEHTILDEINAGINGFANAIDNKFIEKLISKGNFIFYLDGFDEIVPDNVSPVTTDIQSFISKAFKNKFVITSRHNDALKSFNNFNTFHIEELKREVSELLLRKYAKADKSVENTEELIGELKRRQSDLDDFLVTPLMIALLYKGYDYKKNIPIKKSLFYRQVYDALFQDHDMSKSGAFSRPKKSKLDIEDFHTLINALGFITFQQGVLGFSKEELVSHVKKAMQFSEINAPILGVIEDLTDNVSLMYKDAEEIVWNHKSLQEYFAAKFICLDVPGEQEKILNSIYETRDFQKFETLLLFCYEIRYPLFKKTIIKNLLEEVTNYHKKFDKSYPNCKDYEKLLRYLVHDSEYTLFIATKEYLEEIAETKWNNQSDSLPINDEHKYKLAVTIMVGFIIKTKNYNSSNTIAVIEEYDDNIIILVKNQKELKPLLNIIFSKNEDYISNKLEINIPEPNFEKLISAIDKDSGDAWIDVKNEHIDEEAFDEEMVWSVLSLIYYNTEPFNRFIEFDKACEILSTIEERALPTDIFNFN